MNNDTVDVSDRSFALDERARRLAANVPWLLSASSIGAAVVVGFLWPNPSPESLLWWLALVIIANAYGVMHAVMARRRASNHGQWMLFLYGYEIGAVVAGSIWGLGIAFFFVQLAQPEQVALLAALFFVASAALSGNSPSFRALAGFLVTLIIPTLVISLYLDAPFYRTLAAGLLLVLLVFLRLAYLSDQAVMANAILLSRVERLAQTLTVANERLTAADAAKTRFLAVASHDLRQPVHAIGLLIGALRQQVTSPEAQENVRRIVSAIEGLTNLFDAILDISKLDAGAVKPRQEILPLSRIFDQLRDHYHTRALQKNLDLRIVRSSLFVRTDAALLSQICQNLVANAVRYTEKGRVVVGARRRCGYAEIQILDTGIGIPATQTRTIFQEFVQLSNPTHDRTKGLGLGLSIVKRTADLLGNQIKVASEVGKGSCFSVTVPTERKTNLPDNPSHDLLLSGSTTLRGAFVVMVDDEEDVLHGMSALLKGYGCHTLTATSGALLLEALKEHERQPDLIITDFRIGPSETGLDVIKLTRETQELEIPALIITGSQLSDELKAAMATGIRVLGKPLNERQLIQVIEETLTKFADVL